ncbi:hypothetical protein [Nonomuraea turcica]|uniref:hypothetical protein n=1 Tax=Nonomuraea sp. G32 TaxID=3067274 RepID=UPI00273B6B0C|nr:hypothetical protein [Nonomuraea sp. G32]MDP4501966.1 hypothetical protein [Nonomuraea sp. G32]
MSSPGGGARVTTIHPPFASGRGSEASQIDNRGRIVGRYIDPKLRSTLLTQGAASTAASSACLTESDSTEAVDGYGRFLMITMASPPPALVTSNHLIVYAEARLGGGVTG